MKFKEINPSPRTLMTPGPVEADPRVLRAMGAHILGQFDPEFTALMNETMEMERYVFQTQNKMTYLVDTTSRGGLETVLTGAICPGDKVLIPAFGRFGYLLAEILERCGADITLLEREWGTVFDPEEIEEELKKVQEQNAREITVDRPAENGDTVVIDFEGSVDGEVFEGGTAENHPLVLGSGSFIPGFEDQLVGATADSDVEVNVTFPEDYQAENLAGKEAVFKVTIHEVKAKEVPELDDEFAKDVDDEVSTLDELKEKYRKELVETKEKAADDAKDEAAIRMAVENAEIVELPHVMVHDEVHRSMDEFLNNMQRQGISPEMYYQLTGSTEEDLHKQFEGEAEMRTRTNLVIEAIAAAENLQATEEEINAEIQELSETYNMPIEQIKRVLTEDMLEHDVTMKKAIELITGTATEAKE